MVIRAELLRTVELTERSTYSCLFAHRWGWLAIAGWGEDDFGYELRGPTLDVVQSCDPHESVNGGIRSIDVGADGTILLVCRTGAVVRHAPGKSAGLITRLPTRVSHPVSGGEPSIPRCEGLPWYLTPINYLPGLPTPSPSSCLPCPEGC